MKILATDLDRTLLPNGSWPADPDAIKLFNELTEKHAVQVVYVTGRNLSLSEDAIRQYGIRHPHFLIGDVGTTIRKYHHGVWHDYEGWDAETIRDAVKGIEGMVEQESEHCGPFKQSYYVDHDNNAAILEVVDSRVRNQYDEVIIYSFDSQTGKGLLDFLPNSATKQTALEFIAGDLGANMSEVVFCGDSGNDVFPLTAGFNGVLVRNADDQLVERVKQAAATNANLKFYFAKGDFKNLNGYYTSGVIEGAYHYGIFDD